MNSNALLVVQLAAGGRHLKARVKGESLRTLVSHKAVYAASTTQSIASVPHQVAVRCDGLVGGGGEVGVFQPGRLHLMRVTQQAP